MWSSLATAGPRRLSSRLALQSRAVDLAAAEVTGVGGWLRPDDRVDVALRVAEPGARAPVATTLLQDVAVLAAGRSTGARGEAPDGARAYQDVTLALLPEEAELLVQAVAVGAVVLTLRGEGDHALDERRRTAADALVAPVSARRPAPR